MEHEHGSQQQPSASDDLDRDAAYVLVAPLTFEPARNFSLLAGTGREFEGHENLFVFRCGEQMTATLALVVALGTAVVPQVAAPPAPGTQSGDLPSVDEQGDDEATFALYWSQGLFVEALRQSFTLRVAGSVQNDSAAFSASGEDTQISIANGVQWRRARVFFDGIFARHFNYKFQYDFAVNNPPNLKDAYVGLDVPIFPLRMRGGRFRAPLGLEGYTSGMDTTFMERGLVSAFLPSRNTGALFISDAGRQAHNLRISFAAIKSEDDFGIGSTDKLGVSARVSYAFNPREGMLWHVGGDYLHRPVNETIRFLSRPEAQISPAFVDTGDVEADSADTGMLELGWVHGPWSAQTEGAFTWINRNSLGLEGPFFWAAYGFISYMISGETRPYQGGSGNFGRLHPADPFFGPDGVGRGALEAAFRVSYLDLDDLDVRGGRLLDLTWGVNWHATRNARVLGNVIRASQRSIGQDTWIAQLRLQWAY